MNECTECHKYVGKCPYCHRPRPSIAEWKALKGVSAPIMSAENRALIERDGASGTTAGWLANHYPDELNTLLDAARSEGPQPPAVKVDEGVRKEVARIVARVAYPNVMAVGPQLLSPSYYASNTLLGQATDQILSLLGFCRNTTIS